MQTRFTHSQATGLVLGIGTFASDIYTIYCIGSDIGINIDRDSDRETHNIVWHNMYMCVYNIVYIYTLSLS